MGYLILYPGLGNWKGLLPGYENGWTGVHEWEKEMANTINTKYSAGPKAIAHLASSGANSTMPQVASFMILGTIFIDSSAVNTTKGSISTASATPPAGAE